MVEGHLGTVADGVFTATDYMRGYASSAPVFIGSLLRGTVVAITLTGKAAYFLIAIASTNALNSDVHAYNHVHAYNDNHHAAFHYSSAFGHVNSDLGGTNGTFAVHYVLEPRARAAETVRAPAPGMLASIRRIFSGREIRTTASTSAAAAPAGGPFTAVLTLRGFDRTVSFSVNGAPQDGVWALPTTESFYLSLIHI